MPTLKIVGLCVVAAILYGIAHDSVTARVCVEYFTIGHVDFLGTRSPTILALFWGTLATWWMGFLLGMPLALIARLGSRPKLTAGDLIRPIGLLLACMAIASVIAGVIGYHVGTTRGTGFVDRVFPRVLVEARVRFLADAFAHQAAYMVGGLGGVVIWGWAWRKRDRLRGG